MANDRKSDLRAFVDEITPLGIDINTGLTIEQANRKLLEAEYERLKLEFAALQARYEERGTLIERLRDERRALANRLRASESRRG